MSIPYSENVKMLDAVTVDGSSEWFDVSKRTANHNPFCPSVLAMSPEAAHFQSMQRMTRQRQPSSRVSQSVMLSRPLRQLMSPQRHLNANGSAAVQVPAGFRFIRVTLDVTTDGAYTAIMQNGG